ncbi:MAG: enoyl-CoA hydratase [Rhodospirillaceae bacterium]|nr:enoyl-CoA hydratase [Magnetovibrio sp.]MAY68136.1 enoyl-CoA hydratase [Rhodospirillaceae bacterium]
MTDDPVLYDQRHGVAILTLNRPDQLNALNFALIDRFLVHLDAIERDEMVRAVIVTGAGDRAFSAGADIKEFAHSVAAGVEVALRDFVARGQTFTARIERFPKPLIGAVNGLAFGGGCEMLEAMPLAVAAATATFTKPEINLGFPPPFGGTQRLPRLIGRKRALEMILTGDPITAEDARQAGLVNRVVPKARLMAEAESLAQRIIEKAPVSVAASLAAVTRGINLSIDEGLAMEAAQFARAAATPAVTQGIARFLARSAGPRAAE